MILAKSGNGYLLPGVDLNDESKAELDLFGVVSGKIHAAEVKHSATWFDEHQIRRDVELSARVHAAVHVIGCAEPLPAGARQTAKRLASSAGLELVIVTNQGVDRLGKETS